MKKLLKPFRHLIALLAVVTFAIITVCLGAAPGVGLLIVGLWQLSQFVLSKRRAICYISGLTAEQIEEFDQIMREVSVEFPKIKGLGEQFRQLRKSHDELSAELTSVKRKVMRGSGANSGVRYVGNKSFVSDECALAFAGIYVACAARQEKWNKNFGDVDTTLARAAEWLGVQKAALATTDIPLPTIYVPQVIELIYRFGQFRQYATVFPLGAGSVNLPQLKAGEDPFTFLGVGTAGISQPVGEKKVSAQNVTFTANKCGGIIRIPSEIEEDTFIPLGQFLAGYIARRFANLEDLTGFLGDGTATYANIKGVGQYCLNNPAYLQQLAAGKTIPTDATVDDFRAIRGLVNPAVFFGLSTNGQSNACYYMNPSLDALLVTFNTLNQPLIYVRRPDGTATLDGYPIRWIGVSQAYKTSAAPNVPLAFFGDLSYWYLGERGSPRVETSREVYFATDEIGMRALERIDVEAMAPDAMSALYTAAN